MTRGVGRTILVALAALGSASAEEPTLVELLEAHSYELGIESGELVGPGAAFLARVAESSQFVALGEAHNNREIPAFTTALFRLLHVRSEYEFLLLEQDPVMMRRVSRLPVKGDREAVRDLARRYPKGFTFISDQELQMLADVAALSSTRASAIWGCEQAFGATHVLDELIERTPASEARGVAKRLRGAAAEAEAVRDLDKGHYMESAALAARVGELVDAFAGDGDGHSRFLVNAVAASSEIYGYYRAGSEGEVPGYYSNNSVREEYMKTRCLEEYRRAAALDQRLPRGIAKHGHWHLYKGQSPGRVPTLGTFLYDFARTHEMGFFSIAIYPFSAEGGDYSLFAGSEWNAFLKPFAPVAVEGGWTLVDLRPFREYPYRELLEAGAALDEKAEEELKRLVYGYDAVLFIGGAHAATYEVTGVAY